MKRKIILILLALVFVFSCVALVACNKGEKEALDTYLLEQDNQLVDADFTLPVKIREYDVTWTSSDSAITLEKRDSDYLAKVTLGDAVKEVTLTVSIGKLSKSFTVRVAEFDVYFIADHYNFVKDKTTVTEDFALDRSFTYQGKTATIDWSVSDAYADYIAISEDGNTCLVYPTSLLPSVRIKATFTYNNESTTYQYTMTVGLNRTHLEEINYWYYNTGVSIDIKGYVVEIATPYDEGYGNVSLYVVDEEFLAGYYVYRVKTDSANAALIEVGAHVTITGTTNTNYNGLIETNAGGNLVVDTDVPKIDVREHVYALDQDVLGNVPAAIYHQSRLVSLTNWTVKSVESAPEAGSTATLFTLTKGGVDVSVAVSKYLEGAYKPTADDATWSALAALTGTVKEGDVVSVTGVLGNYNGAQIMPLKASDVVVGGTADPDGTVYPGQTAAKAIAAVNAALKQNGVDKRITKTTEFTLPTESNGVAIAYEICGSPRALTLDGSKFTVTPDKHEIATVKVTYTLKDGETVVYSTVQFFDVESLVPTASTIMDELVAPPAKAEKDFELDANATWEVVEGTGITIENGVAKLTRTAEDQKVTLKATVSYNNETKTKNFVVTVAADPYLAYYRITLDVDTMQLVAQSYQDGTVTIDRVAFEYTELGNYGDGIQMRSKPTTATTPDELTDNSTIKNTNAFHAGIKMIVVTWSDTKSVSNNTNALSFKFGTSADALGHEVMLSTVQGQTVYEIVPDAETYTYFSLEKTLYQYSMYFKSIQICFTEPNDITYTDEEKVDAELAALKVDKLTYTEDGTATLPVAGTTHTDVTISWASNNAAVVVDGANLAVTMPASNAKVTLTATVKAGTVEKTKSFTLNLVVDVVDAAYALESGESLNGFTLTGVIGKIDDAYSEQFGNITVTIVIDNRVDQPIQCFRLKGEGCDTLAVGDKITVTGNIVNYNGTIEFNSGCTLDAKTTATAEEIAIAKFAFVELAKEVTENFTLPEGITWTVKEGTAITIDGVNATVVRGDADATVVITGTLNGHTRDFTVVVKATGGGSVEPPVEDVMTVAEALAAANALGKDEYSAEKVYVEGVIAEITNFDSGRSSYTFYIKDADGTDQLTVFSCKTTADITKIYVGDTVKVYGYLQNHKGNTPEVTYQGDENPVFVTLTRGTSAITVAENDNVTVTLSAQSGENGTEFSFTIVVDTPEYVLASVAVNGTTVTATDGVYRAIIDGPTTVVVSGYVPSTESSIVTVDFKANFGTYGGSWSNSYAEHTITSADLGVDASEATFNVVLSNASKQTGTITDMPVICAKNTAQYVTASLSSGTIAGVTFNLKEWTAKKKFTTITIEYTTDGATWQPTNVGLVDGTATTVSPDYTTVSAVDLTEGVIGVRLVYVGNSSKNQQIGLEGLTLTVK
ncbi:MAG TPA: OB-fold nucleic acid binding domain-containing protein [Candidatus Fimimonas gallinarum]|uniref:OB-fold nucleic acid binding domain-containing protein n=1 Tax=Candidatus Fimimonas gallinarum TaxID=2840821 RepID=A0A9D1E4Y4_9BACT|nr:OB-fold nucleic acid binding domain-containing protein [Candidatus Fimimonas gallinarum]